MGPGPWGTGMASNRGKRKLVLQVAEELHTGPHSYHRNELQESGEGGSLEGPGSPSLQPCSLPLRAESAAGKAQVWFAESQLQPLKASRESESGWRGKLAQLHSLKYPGRIKKQTSPAQASLLSHRLI